MTALGLDRRILRAFYTQYVAVLLIILVFFVAAFQTASLPKLPHFPERATIARSAAFGEIMLSEAFLTDGFSAEDHDRLRALVEVLRAHDVTASVELTVPRMALAEVDNGAIRAATLTEQLDQFFRRHGVPSGSVRYAIRDRVSGRTVGGVVRIHETEGGNE